MLAQSDDSNQQGDVFWMSPLHLPHHHSARPSQGLTSRVARRGGEVEIGTAWQVIRYISDHGYSASTSKCSLGAFFPATKPSVPDLGVRDAQLLSSTY